MAPTKRRLGRGLDKMISDPSAISKLDNNEENKSQTKKTATKKTVEKKTEEKKNTTAKKSSVKKETVAKNETPEKKATSKKTTVAKKETVKKDPAKRTTSKKEPVKKEVVKKEDTTKSTRRKATTKTADTKATKVAKNVEDNIDVINAASVQSEVLSTVNNEKVAAGETYLRVSEIEPNRNQPRKKFDKEALEELADSIKTHGIIQPIVVQKRDGYYEIIAGERRWRAAKIAKIKEVPVIIKEYTEREIMEIALIENLQRENLNPIEEAESYNRLIEEYGLIQEELAQRMSKSRSAITNSLRLLKLSKKVREMVASEKISGGHARALVVVEDEKLQFELATLIYENKLSVRETEKLIKNRLNAKPKQVVTISPETEMLYKSVESTLKDIFSTRVAINAKKNGKGKIEIDYYSEEDLDRILGIIKGN